MIIQKGKFSGKLINIIFFIIIFSFIIFTIIFNVLLQKNLEDNISARLEKDNYIIAEYINSYFIKYDEIVNQMLNNTELTDYIREIKSYEERVNSDNAEEISEILTSIEESDEDGYIGYAWLGIDFFDGVIISDINYEPDEGYKMEDRSWYNEMLESDTLVTNTEPYEDIITQNCIISIVAPVYDGDKFVGNVGIDINIEDLQEYVNSYYKDEDKYAFIINDEGAYIVYKNESYDESKNILDDDDPLKNIGSNLLEGDFDKVITFTDSSTKVDYYLAYDSIDLTDWYVASVIPQSEMRHQILMLNIMSSIILIVSAIIFVAFFINQRKSRAINTLKRLNREIHNYSEQLAEKERYIKKLAYIDPLTGIANRRKFLHYLEESLAAEHTGAVVLVDLDNFKMINDTKGHVYGDKLLSKIAIILSEIEKEEHIRVCRFGGDEFLILLDELDIETIKKTSLEIMRIFSNKITVDEEEIFIGVSMGLSLYPKDSNVANQLIMYADLAMYSVKNAGKNNYAFFDESMTKEIVERTNIENILRAALINNEFYLMYQPQVDIKSCEIIGFEALLRLKDNILGPNIFIPVAEKSEIIVSLGRWVAHEAVKQLAKWQSEGIELKPVSINFSAKQIDDKGFVEYLDILLRNYGVSPEYLEIEITESAIMENKQDALKMLNSMRANGFKLALDDFGTGYSSLSYLIFLPIDKIKLDKTICDRYLDKPSINVINNIIDLSHSLNMKVVAEGIEYENQYHLLETIECDYIQGYFFSKPMNAQNTFEEFNRNYKDLIKDNNYK